MPEAGARSKRSSSNQEERSSRKRPNIENAASFPRAEEAITEEEIQEAERFQDVPSEAPQARNAFTALMAPKPKPPPKANTQARDSANFAGRNGLGLYLANPSSTDTSIIFQTPHSVAIRDLFPKSTVHTLLLPRDPTKNMLHPFDAFDGSDPAFLANIRADAARLKDLVAQEVRRTLGRYSQAEAERNAVLDGDVEDEGGEMILPPGRDWAAEVKVGVHSVPSMNHLHVHVLSRDMHSERMKHRKHYNSFTTEFFVPLDEFPMAEDDSRRRQHEWPSRPLICWRCGRDFGNRFKELNEHLEVEFEAWKKE